MEKNFIEFDPLEFEPIRAIALQFPGVEDSLSHNNTPSLKVGKKFLCRLHESGNFIAIRMDFALRDAYLNSHPEIFHLPDHYKAYPSVCLWLPISDKSLLKEVIEFCWRALASKKQITEWDRNINKQ